MSKMLRVTDLYLNGSTPLSSYIEEILTDTTNVGDQVYLFSDIFMPVRLYDEETGKLAEDYEYVNVGMTTTELADLYWTMYSGEYLIGAGRGKDLETDILLLKKRCRAIFKKNYGKYLKLIELIGLEWNPLWNVDGVEMHQLLESHGDEANVRTSSTKELQGSNNRKTHDTTPYNDTGYRTEWKEDETGQSAATSGTVSATYGGETYSAQAAATDVAHDIGSAEASLDKKMHEQISYSVNSKDTVFGTGLSGADILHTEKTIRQGNIGVTKTTELLNDAREALKFNIIEEFFKDINKVILIGVYDQ